MLWAGSLLTQPRMLAGRHNDGGETDRRQLAAQVLGPGALVEDADLDAVPGAIRGDDRLGVHRGKLMAQGLGPFFFTEGGDLHGEARRGGRLLVPRREEQLDDGRAGED